MSENKFKISFVILRHLFLTIELQKIFSPVITNTTNFLYV